LSSWLFGTILFPPPLEGEPTYPLCFDLGPTPVAIAKKFRPFYLAPQPFRALVCLSYTYLFGP
jgi:hypothetical protein